MNPEHHPVRPPHPDPSAPDRGAEGCLTVALRLPVRIVVLVLVLPARVAWDALTVAGRFLTGVLPRPLGRALLRLARALFVWPWAALWRWAVLPVAQGLGVLGHVLLLAPARWLYARVLTPLGHACRAALTALYARVLAPLGRGAARLARATGAAVAWLAHHLLLAPRRLLYARVLAPAGRALLWLAGAALGATAAALRVLLVLPALVLWRRVLAPALRVLAVAGREAADALGHAWRVAGHLSRALGRALATLFRWILADPARLLYRTVLTPAGHVLRGHVLRPAARAARAVRAAGRQALDAARDTLRETRRDLRRILAGTSPAPVPGNRREPQERGTRTLGGSTTALTKD